MRFEDKRGPHGSPAASKTRRGGAGGPRRSGGPRDSRGPRPPRPPAEERLSRFLAYVLRHHPEEVGLTLDERGAVDLDALAAALQAQGDHESVTRDALVALATTGGAAQRFEITGNLIRARYGHSFAQAIQYEPAEPPEFLFHGTAPSGAEQIVAEGLKAGERQRVHLSIDTPAAREVGRRRCPDPVIFRVDTAAARQAGIQFYRAGPAVWLSDDIPPAYLTRVE